jgi:hypothetical protein
MFCQLSRQSAYVCRDRLFIHVHVAINVDIGKVFSSCRLLREPNGIHTVKQSEQSSRQSHFLTNSPTSPHVSHGSSDRINEAVSTVRRIYSRRTTTALPIPARPTYRRPHLSVAYHLCLAFSTAPLSGAVTILIASEPCVCSPANLPPSAPSVFLQVLATILHGWRDLSCVTVRPCLRARQCGPGP